MLFLKDRHCSDNNVVFLSLRKERGKRRRIKEEKKREREREDPSAMRARRSWVEDYMV